jgi:hypothetical protein
MNNVVNEHARGHWKKKNTFEQKIASTPRFNELSFLTELNLNSFMKIYFEN